MILLLARFEAVMDLTYVVSIVGHPHLGPDQQDLSIVDDHSTVKVVVLVRHRPAGRLIVNTMFSYSTQ